MFPSEGQRGHPPAQGSADRHRLSTPDASLPCEPSEWNLLEMRSWQRRQSPSATCVYSLEVWPGGSLPALLPAQGPEFHDEGTAGPGLRGTDLWEAVLGLRGPSGGLGALGRCIVIILVWLNLCTQGLTWSLKEARGGGLAACPRLSPPRAPVLFDKHLAESPRRAPSRPMARYSSSAPRRLWTRRPSQASGSPAHLLLAGPAGPPLSERQADK